MTSQVLPLQLNRRNLLAAHRVTSKAARPAWIQAAQARTSAMVDAPWVHDGLNLWCVFNPIVPYGMPVGESNAMLSWSATVWAWSITSTRNVEASTASTRARHVGTTPQAQGMCAHLGKEHSVMRQVVRGQQPSQHADGALEQVDVLLQRYV